MNRNTILGIIVAGAVAGIAVLVIFRGEGVFDVSLFGQDETELERFGEDIATLSRDAALLDEIDQAFDDITGEGIAITAEEALDEASINQEGAKSNLTPALNAFGTDDVVLEEIDEAFGEVSQ